MRRGLSLLLSRSCVWGSLAVRPWVGGCTSLEKGPWEGRALGRPAEGCR